MTRHKILTTRAIPALLFGAAIFVAVPALAQSSRVISVEEHWELKLAEPDSNSSGPQTTMVMSPIGDLTGTHFFFTLNHSAVPEYHPGGMQVQLWNGEEFVDDSVSEHSESLEHDGETVTWVQRLSLADGTLKFEVDGDSETWGHFGGPHLTLSTDSPVTSLNGYRPGLSLGESQVSYAENRVTSLTLTKLVWVTEDGVVHEHDAPIPIDISLGD